MWKICPHELRNVATSRKLTARIGPVTRAQAPRAKAMPLANAIASTPATSAPAGGVRNGASTPTGSHRAASAWIRPVSPPSAPVNHTTA